jgi:hypothetical protein
MEPDVAAEVDRWKKELEQLYAEQEALRKDFAAFLREVTDARLADGASA